MDDIAQGPAWTTKLVHSEKSHIKEHLRRFDPIERGLFLQQKINRLANQDSSIGRLHRYIYVVYALLHHIEYPHLSAPHIRQGLRLAYSILKVQRISPRKSALSGLYKDLLALKSQLCRLDGCHLRAAFEHGSGLTGQFSSASQERCHKITYANQLLRLGHAALAEDFYGQLDDREGEGVCMPLRLARVRSLRLMGATSAAKELLQSTEKLDLEHDFAQECRFESLCLNVCSSGDGAEMMAEVFFAQKFDQPGYMLEAILWSLSLPEKKWLSHLPKLEIISKKYRFQIPSQRSLYATARVLRQCYAYDHPYDFRRDKLLELLQRTHLLFNIDHELLTWAAACRFFLRSKSLHLAVLALKEYQSLCLRLSSGASKDVFGILGDLARARSIHEYY